ncbi:TonB-dependent receptor [Roseateles asaccharophilus]|uniref:Iron complex outermembrane receptor protein n=1 Tax=Roseateles asaccharophilus TaxID=582607 RepID=A0ABU2ACX6_9BURK|nr:TonB-dependent receptor [Roseateles asaccharophilus]MDR7334960.1 iron complex outermembrane receptor protein [Roseateles asaccharophilus]
MNRPSRGTPTPLISRPRATHVALACALMSTTLPALAQTEPAASDTSANGSTLPSVRVSGKAEAQRSLAKPTTASRLGLSALETPASIEVLSGDTVRERGDTTVLEAASRATGIAMSGSPGNGGTGMSARGFNGHGSVMQLFDGTRLYVGAGTITFPFDPWSTERIEVLRGAASVIYGEGAIGGAINLVPKKPTRGPIQSEIRVAIGSDNARQLAIGSGGAIDERWSYRVDISHRATDGFMPRGDAESLAMGGALRLDVSPTLSFTLSRDEGHQQPQRYFGVPLIDGKLDDRNKHQNYNVDDAVLKYRDRWTRLDAQWTPRESVQLRNQLYHLDSRRHWRNAENYSWDAASGRVRQSSFLEIGHQQEQIGNRTDLRLSGALAGMQNQLSIGLELNHTRFTHINDSPYFSGTVAVDPFAPVVGQYRSAYAYTPRYRAKAETQALFIEDRLTVNEHWSVVAGLRHDHARLARTDLVTASSSFGKAFDYTSGRLGLVFAPSASQSAYVQIGRAVDPLGALLTTSAAQQQFDLTTGRQIELGYKQLLGERRGAWSVAAYRIEKNKILSRDPLNPNVQQQIGQQSSEGLEATLELALTDTLRLEANAARLRARFDDFQEIVGGSLVSRNGNTPTGVPETTANVWLRWNFLPAWTAAAGARHIGPRQVDTANTRQITSYTVADATLAWQAMPDLRLNLQVFNLFNRDYALSTSNSGNQWLLGRPRGFELAAHVRF